MRRSDLVRSGIFILCLLVSLWQTKFSLLPVLRALGKSVPLVTYVIACTLSILRISLPGPVVQLAGIVGNANAFLAMLMLGVGFQLDLKRVPEVLRLLLPRYLAGIAMAALCWFFLPVPAKMKGDYELASAVNSFSILISIALIIAALMFL